MLKGDPASIEFKKAEEIIKRFVAAKAALDEAKASKNKKKAAEENKKKEGERAKKVSVKKPRSQSVRIDSGREVEDHSGCADGDREAASSASGEDRSAAARRPRKRPSQGRSAHAPIVVAQSDQRTSAASISANDGSADQGASSQETSAVAAKRRGATSQWREPAADEDEKLKGSGA